MGLTVAPSELNPVLNNFKGVGGAIRDTMNSNLVQKAALLDNQSKSNIYATQILSAASATGDQNAYDQAKQHLAGAGIDVSTWAPDVQSGAQQAQAARLAQSPLGSLLNAGLKGQSNQIALSGLTGQITPGAMGLNIPGMAPPKAQSQSIPQDNFLSTEPDTNSPSNIPDAGVSMTPQASAQPVKAPIETPTFQRPPQNPGETLPAYKDRVQQAFEQYKANPDYIAAIETAKSQAGESGKLSVQNAESAKKADELTKRLEMNLNSMLSLNKNVPSSGLIPASAKVYADQAEAANGIGSGTGASAANQWDQINNQQVLSEIQQFIASGGANTRINQTLDKIVQAASGINRNDLPQSREAQIKNALAEIQNKNVSAQNIAGDNQPYQPIPVMTSQAAQQSKADFDASKLNNPDAIKAAFQAGAISKDQALQLLKTNHGFN